MSEIDVHDFKNNVKNFEQRVISKSILESSLYSKIADKILEILPASIKPGTLSLLSFLPLCILSMFPIFGDRIWFILALIALFIHQIMDIANKKQAYRLKQFSLGTFYIDHIYDSLSCGIIVGIITRLMQFKVQNVWISVFLFGFLPFYLAHLAMVSTGHLQFELINPATQGIFLIQILLLISAIFPPFFKVQIYDDITILYVVTVLSSIWLGLYVLKQIWRIMSSKQKNQSPLKSFIIIIVLGYIFFQNTIIEKHFIQQQIFFGGLYLLNLTHFSLIISNLIINFSIKNSYPDLTINTLIITTAIVILYSVSYLVEQEQKIKLFGCEIAIWVLASLQFVYFVYTHVKVLKKLNEVHSD